MIREEPFQKMYFVHGKGGVGKTLFSKALARSLPGRVLWICFEDPTRKPQELRRIRTPDAPGATPQPTILEELNCDSSASFQEYVGLKIGVPALAKLFLQSKLVQYLSQAAPGIRDLVLLGKAWALRTDYDHVICDMPSTGHGLAMFQSMGNFSNLFGAGPLARDAESMLVTFNDPQVCRHWIVSLPEEMPLVESLELGTTLKEILPANPARFIVNRLLPGSLDPVTAKKLGSPSDWTTPVATSFEDYARKRWSREHANLEIWNSQNIGFESVPQFPTSGADLLGSAVNFLKGASR